MIGYRGIRFYRLVGRTPVAADNLMSGLMERRTMVQETGVDPWRVAFTEVGKNRSVSTVFLGLDRSYFGGDPLVFETITFVNGSAETLNRCSTWEQAEALHERTVVEAKTGHLKVIK